MKNLFIKLFVVLLFIGTACGCDNDQPPVDSGNDPADPGEGEMEVVELNLVNAFPNLTFDRPVDFQSPDDGTDRIFVVEQSGTIRTFANASEAGEATIFLNIENDVDDSANEQGLLGLAFHPDFDSNGFFYVNYNPSQTLTRISKFQVSSSDPDVADPNSETVLLEYSQPFTNHNGGQLTFGPDGFLYISSGDGGDAGDPMGNGQNISTLLGAILRIDVNATSPDCNYAIPNDNPFVTNTEARGEIFAYGLRNPWRISFDQQTGVLWAADVGQDNLEEIDIIEAGNNYGWNIMEGTACFGADDCDRENLVFPVFEYTHENDNESVTGGYVYRGETAESLKGRYIYADFISGRVWALTTDLGTDLSNELLMDTDFNISSFGTDGNNELYVCTFNGSIYKFEEN